MRLWNGYAGLLKWSQQTVHWLSQLGGNPCASLQALPTLAHSPLLFHLSYFHRKRAPSIANTISDSSVITKRVLDLSNISLFAYIIYNDNLHRKQFHHRKKKKKKAAAFNVQLRIPFSESTPVFMSNIFYRIKLSSFRHTSCYKYKYRNKVPLVVDYCNKWEHKRLNIHKKYTHKKKSALDKKVDSSIKQTEKIGKETSQVL